MLTPAGDDLTRVELRLQAFADERLWGLGQHSTAASTTRAWPSTRVRPTPRCRSPS
jgi:hypothetical protein